MPRSDRAQYLNYEVSGKWLIRFYEEADDFVILVQHYPTQKVVLRFDQSSHDTFHSDFYNDPKYEDFGVQSTFADKVNTAFVALEQYCIQGKVNFAGDKLEYSNVIDDIRNQILNKEVSKGTDRNFRNISAMASIAAPVNNERKI